MAEGDPEGEGAVADQALDHSSESVTAADAPAIKTVFIISMENKNWWQIKNSGSAPYINGQLMANGSYTEQYYNPSGNHPSLGNYIWMEAGSGLGIRDDNPPAQNHQSTTQHLTRLLEDASISWKSYQEDIPGTSCPLTDVNRYAPKHNANVYFDDMTGNRNPNDAHCIAHNRPYSELATDLTSNSVARYNFITPNLCNDMHDFCSWDPVRQGDDWLKREVPKILASRAYQDGGVLMIWFDEAWLGDGPIAMIVMSPLAKGHGYSNSIRYSHGSTLRTLQLIFGVRPFLGDAATSNDLSDLFTTFP